MTHPNRTFRPRSPAPYRLFSSPNGRKVAIVEVEGGSFQIYAADLAALRDQFGIVRPCLNSDGQGHLYVVGWVDGRKVPIARLLTQAKRGQRVTYHDGNGLNLRRDNLTVGRGYSRRPAVTASEEKSAA